MLELGAEGEALHADFGRAVAGSCIELFIAVGPAMAAAHETAVRGDLERRRYADARSAAAEVPALLAAGDVVLVKGSRGVALEQVVESIREAFGVPPRQGGWNARG
jgi:UDP-N-acetylmuramoyl-tripeptide--D-alanyl-D-alanine ligase